MSKIRLQKYLASSGIASRRQCEEIIKSGRIKVNDTTITEMGFSIDPKKDTIQVDDKIIEPEQLIYYALNKPRGYTVTVSDPFAKKTIISLIPPHPRVFPVGRLDRDSEGLLILTNDGDLSFNLTHPKFSHEKEYTVEALTNENNRENITQQLQKLETSIILEDGPTRPAKISNIQFLPSRKTVIFNIIIKEGRNRQIRRMLEAINLTTVSLKRIRISNLKLNDLKIGQFKIITKGEIYDN